jgi:hypothetical protein
MKLTAEQIAKDYPRSRLRPSPDPLAHYGHTRNFNRRGEIRYRLGITDADMENVPDVTRGVQKAIGSTREAIELLEGDDSPLSQAFVKKYRELSASDKKMVKLEEVIVASGMTTRRFWELLAGASFDDSSRISKIFAAQSQLKVLKATVKAATDEAPIFNRDGEMVGKTNGDVKAMEIFHKITGAMPTPKGANITLNTISREEDTAPTEARQPLQTMDSWLLEIDDIRKPRQLKSPQPVEIPVEMPEGVPEIEYLGIED